MLYAHLKLKFCTSFAILMQTRNWRESNWIDSKYSLIVTCVFWHLTMDIIICKSYLKKKKLSVFFYSELSSLV